MQTQGDTLNLDSLEMTLKKQGDEIKALRMLLESMNRKLEEVYKITEAKAISFARSDETL